MNIAVILAGGSGRRFARTAGSENALPKQFLMLAGKTVIEHSIDTFCDHHDIDEVAVVVHPDWRDTMQTIVDNRRWPKMHRIIDGGAERYMSSINAIMAYIDYPDDTNLLLHDAARPLVTAETISRVVDELRHSEAVGVGVPSTDTVWEVHPDFDENHVGRFVARIPERRLMWRAQTPQAFRLPLLRDAYQIALQDPQFSATDDCGVVRHYIPGTKIHVVEGNESNIKITNAEDLRTAELIAESLKTSCNL